MFLKYLLIYRYLLFLFFPLKISLLKKWGHLSGRVSHVQAGFCWLQPRGIMYHVLLPLYTLYIISQIQRYIIWLNFRLTYSDFFVVLSVSIRRHVMSGFLCFFFASWLMPRSIHSLGVTEVCDLLFLQNLLECFSEEKLPSSTIWLSRGTVKMGKHGVNAWDFLLFSLAVFKIVVWFPGLLQR